MAAVGIDMGVVRYGGDAVALDPCELFELDIIACMSAVVFWLAVTGKSSCAYAFDTRSVLAGRKLSVAADKKGEWTPVVQGLGGAVIRVGPGMPDRINPLDVGTRLQLNGVGKPLGD